MTKKKKQRFPDGFVDWMDGYCEAFEDLSDGAWQSCCENAVEDYNKIHKTNIDSFDGWMHWITVRGK